MTVFVPNLTILPPPQLQLWSELDATPEHFTLYGGTALALRFGHRSSVDFDFFSNQSFDPDQLGQSVPYLRGAERVQVSSNTLTCRVERDGSVLVSFFGALGMGQAAPSERAQGRRLSVASVLDVAASKVAVVQKRAEPKDYLDIAALLQHGIDLPTALSAGRVVFGRSFNPLLTLKALSYFEDVLSLSDEVRQQLTAAVEAVDLAGLPILTSYVTRPEEDGDAP